MKTAPFAAAMLLAGCATTPSAPPAGANWLVGTWLMMEPGLDFPDACNSDLPIRYGPDGRYDLATDSGTWRLDGDRLTEIATRIHYRGEEGTPRRGRPYVSRLARTGPDAFRKTFADGSSATFRRCPPP